ncbi:protein of unknown function DUF201 [Beutenbergia cavernae DSM 12333]|uniref:ATP-grasp domain-containing protein n=1 Tax=Beutenbergia cavernae (strain ATCC BAA-8 / DSM 12333 / CCUG 43141 / JCM 11478 / NBRC 16432 / NCIMB 13614 / HKI 0122) TaxID=471853 RepID=C5BWE8_BEUC1|nr:ATP-grasp domain-containing protein [Beutenbergia cavernae]ACQ78606.1 protein of unknown function DUF201 [Beutenbergia cavernae DSM 12333]
MQSDSSSDPVRTVLITGIGGPAGRSLGAQLARRRVDGARLRLVGVDMAPVTDSAFDVIERVPAAADPDYDAHTLDLVRRHRPELVVPTVSEELPQLSVLATAAGGPIVVSPPGPTAVAADKLLTMWALERAGVPVPRFAPASAFGSAGEALDWAGGPVVVKPRVARGGRGVRVVEHADDDWSATDGSWIVQTFAPGVEYSPQLYRAPGDGGTVVVLLEKTGRKEGRVGNATTVTRVPDGEAIDAADVAAHAAAALGLVGPLDMDVRRDADGIPVLLEVNARFGAVSAHAPELLDAVLGTWGT